MTLAGPSTATPETVHNFAPALPGIDGATLKIVQFGHWRAEVAGFTIDIRMHGGSRRRATSYVATIATKANGKTLAIVRDGAFKRCCRKISQELSRDRAVPGNAAKVEREFCDFVGTTPREVADLEDKLERRAEAWLKRHDMKLVKKRAGIQRLDGKPILVLAITAEPLRAL